MATSTEQTAEALSLEGSESQGPPTKQRESSVFTGHSSPPDHEKAPEDDADTIATEVASPTPPATGSPTGRSSPADSSKAEFSPFVERSNPMGSGMAQTVSSKDPKAVAQAATDMKNVVRRKLTGYVGFANLPNQWHRKSVRKGFNFNVMVVGEFVPPYLKGERKIKERELILDCQVNLVSENQPSSTLCSTAPSTLPRSALPPATTSSPRPCPSSPSALTSKRTVSASA